MGIWIEFRCENRVNPSSWGEKRTGKQCESHDNNGPMELAGDTQESVRRTVHYLTEDALKAGWRRTRYGWICKFCASQPTVMDELKADAESTGQEA